MFALRCLRARAPLQLALLAWLGLVLPAQRALGEGEAEAGSEPSPATAKDARPAPPLAETATRGTSKHRSTEPQVRRRARSAPNPRLANLAVMRGKVAAVAHLHGSAAIEPAGHMTATAEHRIRVQRPDKPPNPRNRLSLQSAQP